MTTSDALTVLRELEEKCAALSRMSIKMGPNPYGDGVAACRALGYTFGYGSAPEPPRSSRRPAEE